MDEDAAGGIAGNDISGPRDRSADDVAERIRNLHAEAAVAQGDRAGDVGADEVALDLIGAAELDANAVAREAVDGQAANRGASPVDDETVDARAGKAAVDRSAASR